MAIGVVAGVCGLAVPAPALARCVALPAGEAAEVPRRAETRGNALRTAVVVCDRRSGRRVVLRRARLVAPPRGRPRGGEIGGAAAAGRRVAWIETRFRGRRRVVEVAVARVGARGRATIERRSVVLRDRSRTVPNLDVAITRRGELAWLVPRRRGGVDDFNRVVFDPPDGPPRQVSYDAAWHLAIEEGATLRWNSADYGYGFFDLPHPRTGECPRRSRYRTVAENADVRVTSTLYRGDPLVGIVVLRACRLSTGRDFVIAQGFYEGERPGLAGLAGGWIVVSLHRFDRYGGSFTLSTVDVATRRTARDAELPDWAPPPSLGDPLAVTERGVPAWLVVRDGVERLLAAATDRRTVELDRGPPGTITALRAEGVRVVWTHAGEPRSAEPR